MMAQMSIPYDAEVVLIEQFEGFFQLKDTVGIQFQRLRVVDPLHSGND
jgi:trehalose/maltose hydrolase-like predicted phosphorylase